MKPRIVIFFVLIFVVFIFAEIINPERRTIWNPGVPRGIPENLGTVENVVQHGADTTGKNDCKSSIESAINSLPESGGVVYFPQGIYLVKNTITIAKNGVILQGDGISKTRLLHDHTGLCFDVSKYKSGNWQKLQTGYVKGSQTVTVEDGSKFKAGGFAEIRQANDSSLMYTSTKWIRAWADSAVGQLFEILSVNGDTLIFRNRLHFDFRADLSPQIRPQDLVKGVGFEKFYIERKQAGNHTFQFKNAAYCWIRNIESYHTRKSHVYNNTTIGCEYRDSYFHHSFSYGDGGSGYGIEFITHCTDGLCENNIFDSLRHSMMVHVGAVGCVFGYNYSINPVQGDGEKNLNTGWVPPDISLHGHYANANLFEGNVVQEIGVGDHWGPMGPGNTFLRNCVQGEGVFLYDHSHKQNFVGNISTKWKDDQTSKNTLRHGENVKGTITWDKAITDHLIPDSYYLKSKPGFYGEMEWPSIGVDKDNGTIPAWERWKTNVIYKEKIKPKGRNRFKVRKTSDKRSFLLDVNPRVNENIHLAIFSLNGRIIPADTWRMSQPGSYCINLKKQPITCGIYLINISGEKRELLESLVLGYGN